MKVALAVVMTLLAGMLLFAIGGVVVKLLGWAPGVLSRFWDALGRGEAVAWLGAGGLGVFLLVLVVMWRGASPGGVHRRGHWEVRGEERVWVPHD